MRLRLVGVRYTKNKATYQPRNLDYGRVESWLRAAYPIGSLISNRTTTTYPSKKGLPKCGEVNKLLAKMKVIDVKSKVATADTRYHGLVFQGPYFMRGCCCNSGASSGPTGAATWGWDYDGSYGDWYTGHEIGHGYGLCHSGACGDKKGQGCYIYPYPKGRIGGLPSDPNRFYGMDVETLQVMGPTWADMMSYCNNQWISDFHYNRIKNRMLNPLSFSMTSDTPQDRLLVAGTVHIDTDCHRVGSFPSPGRRPGGRGAGARRVPHRPFGWERSNVGRVSLRTPGAEGRALLTWAKLCRDRCGVYI